MSTLEFQPRKEDKDPMKSLLFWHKVFAISFIVFVIVATIGGMALLKEISAVSQCVELDDREFVACYESKK